MAANLTAYGPTGGVSFHIGATAQGNIPISAWTTLTFGSELWVTDNNFASNTFTAPVTGRYQLQCVLYFNSWDASCNYVQIRFNTSNRQYYVSIYDGDLFPNDATYCEYSSVSLVDMDASDTATTELFQAGGGAQMDMTDSTGCQFSGFLIG